MVNKKTQENREQLYVIGIIILLVVCCANLFLTIWIFAGKPPLIIEVRNNTCTGTGIDTSWEQNSMHPDPDVAKQVMASDYFSYNPNNMTCFVDNTKALHCNTIKLKNGTTFSYQCWNDFAMHYTCVNSSEIESMT